MADPLLTVYPQSGHSSTKGGAIFLKVGGTSCERSEQNFFCTPQYLASGGYNWKLQNEKTITRNIAKTSSIIHKQLYKTGMCPSAAVRLPLQRIYHKALRNLHVNQWRKRLNSRRKVKDITIISS